jgi:cell wall-associated NlpC family hydrolase
MWLWAKHGVSLPHFAASQFALGPVVERGPVLDESKLRPGDLLFFHELGHVGIYLGDGLLLHAPHTGTVVQISHLSEGWFQNTFVGATEPGGP